MPSSGMSIRKLELITALADRWVTFNTTEIVASHPSRELFCRNGKWFIRSHTQQSSGIYTIEHDRLCRASSQGEVCHKLSIRDGQLRATSTSGAAMTSTIEAAPDAFSDIQTLCR